MKTRSILFAVLCASALALLPASMAWAQQNPTAPQVMPIGLAHPKPAKQTGLRRPQGDGNLWTFVIEPQAGIRWVEGPTWSYPGKGAGADPAWGQWGGGDGQMWLSWISPEIASAFTIKVTGKILPDGGGGGGGGGEVTPIDIEASWEGEVTSFTMAVRRMNSGAAFSGSATVAAGDIGNAGHQAEIEITAKDEAGNPMAGVTVPAIRVSSDGQDAAGTINASPPSMNSTVTDANGKATGTFTSGNRVEATTLTLDTDGDAATTEGEPSVGVNQVWNELGGSDNAWESGEYFTTGVRFPIIYKMTFDDGIPITGHTINFKTKSITGWEWNDLKPVDEDGDGVTDYYGDYDEDKTYDDSNPKLQPGGIYADLVKYVPKTTTGTSDGEYLTDMTANDLVNAQDEVDFYTDVVTFGIEDTSIRIYK